MELAAFALIVVVVVPASVSRGSRDGRERERDDDARLAETRAVLLTPPRPGLQPAGGASRLRATVAPPDHPSRPGGLAGSRLMFANFVLFSAIFLGICKIIINAYTEVWMSKGAKEDY